MSDLISRSAMMKRLEAWNTSDDMDKALYNFALQRVLEQPTVYNIDKIIEELELHSFELGTDSIPAHYVRLNDAIEIVKRGGVMRLIDADKLESIDFSECVDSMEIMAIIDMQPTVYDVDKVVEELKECSKDVSKGYKGADRNYHRHYKAVNTNKAIEIVKRGGVNDD